MIVHFGEEKSAVSRLRKVVRHGVEFYEAPEKGAVMKSNDKLDDLRAEVARLKKAGVISVPGEKPVRLEGAAGRDGVQTKWVTIIPALAKEWIAHNRCNRRVRQTLVAAYARDMRSGNWASTHQGIAFGESGALLDGQHRLHAIIESGCAVTMMVTTGLPEKSKGAVIATMDAVDRGAVRSVADQLKIQHGIKDAPAAQAAANVIAQICIAPGRLNRTTVAQVLQILDVYGEHIVWAIENQSAIKNLRNATVTGAVAFARAVKRKEAEDFYERFVSGENLTKTSPILHLRNFLVSELGGGRGSHFERLKATNRVLNAMAFFVSGKPLSSLAGLVDAADEFVAAQAGNVARVKAIVE